MGRILLISFLISIVPAVSAFAYDTYNSNRQHHQSHYGDIGPDGRAKTVYVHPYYRNVHGHQQYIHGYWRRPSHHYW